VGEPTALSVLDLSPVLAGGTPATALRDTVGLAQAADALGYRRYWLAEHHFAAGVASSVPAVLVAAVAAATERIRVGSGAVLLGHRTAVDVAEQFGTLAGLYPGRIDLGVGRSGHRALPPAVAGPSTAARPQGPASGAPAVPSAGRVVDGLLLPAPFSVERLLASPRAAALAGLLQQPGASSEPFAQQVDAVLALLDGTYRTPDGELVVSAAAGAGRPEVWVLGSSAGESAELAGRLGLPFGANYHVSPGTVLEAVEAYRSAFRPSASLERPYVLVSADVVVGTDDEQGRRLAAGYGLWVLSIRQGLGALPYPTQDEALGHAWTAEERALVADRVETQFVGSPATVVERLRTLQRVTAADELLVTTITAEHGDRVRSLELLVDAWSAGGR
jgi:alkanesulfonate monooxygenase SsuD/methylene tetrahydromethanopterin reductase-like flavin-dependent oxidoreductase (luciferase family)